MNTKLNLRNRFSKLIGTLSLAAAILAPTAASAAEHNLDGIWRGKLEVQPNVFLVVGININGDTITMDSPTQGNWGLPLKNFEISATEFKFSATELDAMYVGKVNGDEITGTFTQGIKRPLTLTRLSAADLERLAFEGRYGGVLGENTRYQLPLHVNVAVIAGGYYGSLDSPAQQTYGIPMTDFSISATGMSFKVPMIQASYESQVNTDRHYEGTFTQGVELPLTLKKMKAGEVLSGGPKPELGEHGGAIAVITPVGTTTKYFAEHDAHTHYEIGSVTKTMVAYLLANSIVTERVTESQSLQSIFAEVPESITLAQLATHTSGLPRLPGDLFEGADEADPYAHYTLATTLAYLADLEVAPTSESLDHYEYSNLGYGVLAEALASVHGKSFAQLIQDELFTPFGMTASNVAMPLQNGEQPLATLAQGYSSVGTPVAPWHFQAMAGAGAVRSTLPDMIRYVEQLIQRLQQRAPAVELLLAPRFTMGRCCARSLGWILQKDEKGQWFAWHNGQTAGATSFVGFYLDGSRAVVILHNQAQLDLDYALNILQGTETINE